MAAASRVRAPPPPSTSSTDRVGPVPEQAVAAVVVDEGEQLGRGRAVERVEARHPGQHLFGAEPSAVDPAIDPAAEHGIGGQHAPGLVPAHQQHGRAARHSSEAALGRVMEVAEELEALPG